MQGLARRLPQVGALPYFEAAGRLLSFTAAAAELHVTQGAVSRQIRLLETAMGVPLFHRRHRAIALTRQGRRLHRVVAMSLEQIAETAAALKQPASGHGVTIAATPAVAINWLIPRLGSLKAALPETEVQVLATDVELRQLADQFDIGIHYGAGGWPGYAATYLDHTEVVPVCSPGYLAGRGPFRAPAELLGEQLLHLDEDRWYWIDWPLWLRRMGVDAPVPTPALRANSYTVLINAAFEGQGIALGWRHLIEPHLAHGLLVVACEARLRPEHAYYLVSRPDPDGSDDRQAVADWIVAQFQAVE